MTIIVEHTVKRNRQVRPNLWQTPGGAVVGYGAMLSPTGFYYCFTCGCDQCQHTQALNEAWLAGNDSIPFDGSMPDGSGDESSEAARLGLPVGW